MSDAEDVIAQLRSAIARVACADAAELVGEARSLAREEARTILAEALTKSMLDAAGGELERQAPRSAADRGAEPPVAAPLEEPPNDALVGDTPAPPPATTAEAWYVYGVIASAGAGAVYGVSGVDPAATIETVALDDLAAVVSRVPLAQFDEAPLRARLSDMAWVEQTARGHERVLEAVGSQQTVVPMRMCSVYRDSNRVRGMLTREGQWLRSALDDLEGTSEWGVKVFAGPPVQPAPPAEPGGAPASGVAYMEQRRRERKERGQSEEAISSACQTIFLRLSAASRRALVVPSQRPEVSGHPWDMVLNSVYLVPDAELPGFHDAVAALEDEVRPLRLELRATGPWPAYNFVPDPAGMAG
jgi:hypothetical protein